jgi:hypothetical protein
VPKFAIHPVQILPIDHNGFNPRFCGTFHQIMGCELKGAPIYPKNTGFGDQLEIIQNFGKIGWHGDMLANCMIGFKEDPIAICEIGFRSDIRLDDIIYGAHL